ncbi:MAG: excinuclease ABC subunit UvrA [Oscillospiraceae bacterium]|nr:excinuclease ABC subunit UvrA [Oscillospiraceae bacterium]
MQKEEIVIRRAKNNNLKDISLNIPRNRLIVITGVSGSGKSSLAFDTIYAEGQRRYVESLSAYARQFLGQAEKPNVESIDGLSPAISIDQKTTSHNPRSTVGTVTEIYDYLRLLYARVGLVHCHVCGREIVNQTTEQMVDRVFAVAADKKIQILSAIVVGEKGTHKSTLGNMQKNGYVRARIDGDFFDLAEQITLEKNKKHTIEIVIDRLIVRETIRSRLVEAFEHAFNLKASTVIVCVEGEDDISFSKNYSCPEHNISIPTLEPRIFSFNNPFGACPACAGLGSLLKVVPERLILNPGTSINDCGLKMPVWIFSSAEMAHAYFLALSSYFGFSLNAPISKLPAEVMKILFYGSEEKIIVSKKVRGKKISFSERFAGLANIIEQRFKETNSDLAKAELRKYMQETTCPVCKGNRLKAEILAVTVGGKNISEFCRMSIKEALSFLNALQLRKSEVLIAERIILEVKNRLSFLLDVGLSYLTLARSSVSISGGESQRLRLATQVGSGLVGVLYILDEPSIGLHPRDNDMLIATLKQLRDLGNTVIVVEHDEETMCAADHIVDVGPGAGIHGGEIVCQGSVEDIKACKNSITGAYLSGAKKVPIPKRRRVGNKKNIVIKGATENNLKNIDITIPLGKFVVVTGVSGSGKSSLINQVLCKAAYNELWHHDLPIGACKEIQGLQNIGRVINVDQSPIGRTPRSNPATYTGVFTDIRMLFAQTPEAKAKGYGPGRFSFNVTGGRCEACSGDGIIKIEMYFLPDVFVPCEICSGHRYNQETLRIKYKGKSIYDVLDMTVEEALVFFNNLPKIKSKQQSLLDVGLGYIKLGQASTTISGGEAQRVKLATELSKTFVNSNLYLLDEPTTGLHVADVDCLISVLHRLVDAGSSVLTIEHNLDVIKNADYIIDLGPEGGAQGGYVVCHGTPEEIAQAESSHTGRYLRKYLLA